MYSRSVYVRIFSFECTLHLTSKHTNFEYKYLFILRGNISMLLLNVLRLRWHIDFHKFSILQTEDPQGGWKPTPDCACLHSYCNPKNVTKTQLRSVPSSA